MNRPVEDPQRISRPVESGNSAVAQQPGPDGPASASPPVPAVRAEQLGLHGRDRWAYREVEFTLPQRSVLNIIGPKGSGRSTLLLTLAGRMQPSDGRLTVFGYPLYPLPSQARAVRRLAAVARIGRVVNLEPRLSIAETVTERALLDVVPPDLAEQRFWSACQLLGLNLHRHGLIEDLPGVEQTLVAAAVALVGAPAFLVLDDVDTGLHSREENRVWQGLRALADTGLTVAAASTDAGPADDLCDLVLRLDPAGSGAAMRGRFH